VSDRTPRISRRKLLQISGLAPLAALAASGASAEEIAAAAREMADLPESTLDELLGKANTKNPGKSIDRKQFHTVVATLWRYCAKAGGLPLPEPDPNPATTLAFLKDAYGVTNIYQEESGDLIVSRLPKWKTFEEFSNVCAYDCGQFAAEAARDLDKSQIEITAYRLGFRRAERKAKKTMSRLRASYENQGKKMDAEIFGGSC
jgi:hypothetical protein